MIVTEATEHWATWTADGHAFAIRYRIAILREMAAYAAQGFAKIPRGGVEVGGILFGHSEAPDRITVEAWRPFECEYRNGPYFEFSSRDHANFERLLSAGANDPDLSDLKPVGWFHSHTRSEIFLSEQDLAIYDRYFRQPWQVAAVLKPEKFDPTRIGFFFRESDGSVHATSTYREFTLPKRTKVRDGEPVAEPVPERLPIVVPQTEVSVPAVVEARPLERRTVEILPIVAPSHPPAKPRRTLAFAALALLLIAAAASAFVFWPRPAPDVGLRFAGTSDSVTLEWDRKSWVVERSSGADLEIRDGNGPPHSVYLDRGQLTSGRLTYLRNSPQVNARMRLYGWGDDGKDFYAVFFGQHEVKSPPENLTLANVEAPVETPKTFGTPVQTSQTGPPDQPAEPRAELQQARTMKLPVRAETVPQTHPAPQLPGAPPPVTVTAQLDAPVVIPRVAAPAQQNPPVRVNRAPAVGRAIWTGELRGGSVLTIDGDRPSFGTVTGRMPSGPARLVAHAAELGAGAIVIYTADPKFRSREDSFESPSARNGWNLTTYKFDPKRAEALSVVEASGPANGWRRLAVRSTVRKISVVVLDWEELPAGN